MPNKALLKNAFGLKKNNNKQTIEALLRALPVINISYQLSDFTCEMIDSTYPLHLPPYFGHTGSKGTRKSALLSLLLEAYAIND